MLQASTAQLSTSVSISCDKLELKVYGFSDKLPVLLSKVLPIAKSFMPNEDRFVVSHIIIIPLIHIVLYSIFLKLPYYFLVLFTFLMLTGHQGGYGEDSEKYEYEAFESFIVFEVASSLS